jgi:hypothetical protein
MARRSWATSACGTLRRTAASKVVVDGRDDPCRGNRMIRWWLLMPAAAAAVTACSPGQPSLAHSPSRHETTSTAPGNHSPVPGDIGSTVLAGKTRAAVLPDVTYPSFGINVSARPPAAPGALAADAVSAAAVLAAFKVEGHASLVGMALGTERPVIMLRTITELHPTAPGVRPHVRIRAGLSFTVMYGLCRMDAQSRRALGAHSWPSWMPRRASGPIFSRSEMICRRPRREAYEDASRRILRCSVILAGAIIHGSGCRDRVGGEVAPPPPTPPDMRARIRRFVKPSD